MHPPFSAESRNVRLGLCTDGFNPFGSFAAPYSCWPVILTVYNLPPGMCMRPEFMFLSMVIPGPSSPGRNIDVCLRPLIDELTQLWSSGSLTYDISRKQNFVMRAALMWTINDFPSLWNGFWLEHAWKASMSILYGEQQGIHANKWG
jgi:hypothetical protein